MILSVLMMVSANANPELDNPQEPEEPENPYSILDTYSATLSKSGSTANVAGSIYSVIGTSKVTIKLELQKKSGSTYSTIKTWTTTKNARSASLTGSYSISSNQTYRLKATFTATKNGSTETATIYKYGVYKYVAMTGVSGVIISSGRSGIWIHGGRYPCSNTSATWYPLSPTLGCVRIAPTNQQSLQNNITSLISSTGYHFATGNISIYES